MTDRNALCELAARLRWQRAVRELKQDGRAPDFRRVAAGINARWPSVAAFVNGEAPKW